MEPSLHPISSTTWYCNFTWKYWSNHTSYVVVLVQNILLKDLIYILCLFYSLYCSLKCSEVLSMWNITTTTIIIWCFHAWMICFLHHRRFRFFKFYSTAIIVKGPLVSVLQFFTTEPHACEPSSLPKYPPSKEIDAKLRDEEARRCLVLLGDVPVSFLMCSLLHYGAMQSNLAILFLKIFLFSKHTGHKASGCCF